MKMATIVLDSVKYITQYINSVTLFEYLLLQKLHCDLFVNK